MGCSPCILQPLAQDLPQQSPEAGPTACGGTVFGAGGAPEPEFSAPADTVSGPLDRGSTTSRGALLRLDSLNAAARLADSRPCARTPHRCCSCAATRSESWGRPR
jgi:hypothetical protein